MNLSIILFLLIGWYIYLYMMQKEKSVEGFKKKSIKKTVGKGIKKASSLASSGSIMLIIKNLFKKLFKM